MLYEAEVWIKDSRGRRKLDIMVKYPALEEAGREEGHEEEDDEVRYRVRISDQNQ
jgi:hypothetical protein